MMIHAFDSAGAKEIGIVLPDYAQTRGSFCQVKNQVKLGRTGINQQRIDRDRRSCRLSWHVLYNNLDLKNRCAIGKADRLQRAHNLVEWYALVLISAKDNLPYALQKFAQRWIAG